MPRKTAAELLAEEGAVSSPLRRSSRIVTGTTAAAAGVTTRRTSQTLEPQTNTPARATRSRRASAQDSEDKVETQLAKPVTRTRRGSILAEEESQKETTSTPSKRTRRPSITTEPSEKQELETSKPVRARRGSTASTTDEPEEKKPPKTAPVRSRRSSANIETEVDVKALSKTPARATTRRRSSAADIAIGEEVSTPAKRTTRGRKTSDVEEIDDSTEVKKPVPRGRRTSVNQEEDTKSDEVVKSAGRRARKISTDDSSANNAPKTPLKIGRRPSITKEVDLQDPTTEKDKISSETLESKITSDGNTSEDEMSPIVLKDVTVRVTPLKKRKIFEKVEAELDLSVINESSDDIDNSKHNESTKEKTGEVEDEKSSQLVSSQTALKEDGALIDHSLNSADETNIEALNISGKTLNTSTKSHQDTSLNKKRTSTDNDNNPSPRKSPRLTEKLSRSNTPSEELEPKKLPTPKKLRNLMKENDNEISGTERPQTSFLSSGSDGSFKFHLSNVSILNSGQKDANKENTDDDILNTSKESTGSNKENIEQLESLSGSKANLNGSVKILVQEPIVVSRVSNVFKPNQKDFSFMEPMDVDEDSCPETAEEKTVNLEKNYSDQKMLAALACVPSVDIPAEESLDSEESSVEFNYKASFKKTEKKLDDNALPLEETKPIPTLELAKVTNKQNFLDTESSDTNVLIEETRDTVNFSIQHKIRKSELQPSTSSQRRSRSPVGKDASLIINQPLEQVKVVLLGKSSSPIVDRRLSKSPIPRSVDRAGTEQDNCRRSKSPCRRSTSRSPTSMVENVFSTENLPKSRHSSQASDGLSVPHRSKSKSPSPRRSSIKGPSFLALVIDQDPVSSRKSKSPIWVDKVVKSRTSKSPATLEESSNDSIRSKSTSPRRSSTKSPSFLCVHVDDKVKPRRSKGDRSKSSSPSIEFRETPVTRDSRKLRSMRSTSKSPLPCNKNIMDNETLGAKISITADSKSSLTDSQENPLNQVGKEHKSRRSLRSMSKTNSPLLNSEDSSVTPDKLITRSKSKSPRTSNLLAQSFENAKGTEEIVVANDKISIEPSQAAINKYDSLKHFAESVSTNVGTTTESQFEVSDINTTASERTNIQDRTEYHTAIATTNNESGFTSVLNTNIEVSQSQIKDSESTDYDFDLDSDEDEVYVSQKGKPGMESNTHNPLTLELRKKIVVELKKSFVKTDISENKPEKDKSLIDNEEAKEKSYIEESGDLLQDDPADKEEETNDRCIQKERQVSETEDKEMEEQSKETMFTLTRTQNDDIDASDSHLTSARTRASFTKLSVDNSSDKNGEVEKMPREHAKQIMIQEKPKDHNQHNISNKEYSMDESQIEVVDQEGCVDLSIILDKIKDANKKIRLKINIAEKEMSASEDILTVDEYSVEKKSPQNSSQEHNESSANDNSRKSKKKNRNKKQKSQQDSKTNESIEEVTSCKMATQKVDKFRSHHTDKNTSTKADSTSFRTKSSLDEFASSKLDEYLNSKADELESSSEEEESEAEYNDFIDGMAEEGEEDTPSEDSNQIIDEGESIGSSTDEDLSDNDYDEDDSFICDEEDLELLSGEEYDLDHMKKAKKKKSRIIDPSTFGDDDIIKIPKKKKVQKAEPKRRTRIITVSDSSDEDQDPSVSSLEIKEKSIKEGQANVSKEQNLEGSIILIEESAQHDDKSNADVNNESKTTCTSNPIVIEETKYDNTSEGIITIEDSKVVDSSKEMIVDHLYVKDHSNITEECDSQSQNHNMSLGNLNASLQKRNRKSSLSIQENILIDGVKDPLISQRINTLVESFCSTVKQGEITLNLSLEYEGTPQEKDKKQTINVLSDVKICMGKPKVSPATEGNKEDVIIDNKEENMEEITDFKGNYDQVTKENKEDVIIVTDKPMILQDDDDNKEEVADFEENYEQEELQPKVSLITSGDLREVLNKRNPKRKLSKNTDDIQEEVREAKKRKTHITSDNNKKSAKTKKKKMHKKLREDVQSTFSSFSIMDQLITDVKSRPRRTMKPTKADAEIESSWATSKITNLKPSTSPVTRQERLNMQPKLHPKDFKNQMLSDDKRVKRIDTKTLLKKKGAFF